MMLGAERSRAAILFGIILTIAVGALFHRSLLYGEVFSPADLLLSSYPWAYEHPHGAPSNPTRSDEALFHQPQMMTHWERLKDGDWPDWDPSILSGVPAFFQGLNVGLAASPLTVPFYVFPADVAVTVYGPLRLVCAALFMWLFLRHTGLNSIGAATGALAFGLNGVFIAWLSAPMPGIALFLPLAALFVERMVTFGQARDAAALALVVGIQFLGAYLPTSLVFLLVTGAYGLMWVASEKRWSALTKLTVAGATGLLVAAIALIPMLANLITSPAATRSMSHVRLPFANLATFAMPSFWGTPVDGIWWGPGDSNYPEYVAYVGVVTLLLAAVACVQYLSATNDFIDRRRVVFFTGLAVAILLYTYGFPPLRWLDVLPGFRQINPLRWNVALAYAVAVLSAFGAHALTAERTRGTLWRTLAAPAVMLLLLTALATVILFTHLPEIRARGLQNYEKAHVARFLVVCGIALTAIALVRQKRYANMAIAARYALPLLVAADLVFAGVRFNPTAPPERVYPWTTGLRYLADQAGDNRVAFIPRGADFLPGHQWSVFGLHTISGFDFHGDAQYQAFLARASGRSLPETRWDYVGLDPTDHVDLKLLGLLNVRYLTTSPVTAATGHGGFVAAGELTAGRTLAQDFVPSHDGLRRVDLLTATYGRPVRGTLRVTLHDIDGNVEVANQTVDAAAVRNNDWLTLDVPLQTDSKGRRYRILLHAERGDPGSAATVWSTAGDGYEGGTMLRDGKAADGDLWFRAFATARARFSDAPLTYSGDFNVYRNTRTMPRAWFVKAAEILPMAGHLTRIAASDFEPSQVAVLETSPHTSPTDNARVTAIDISRPDVRAFSISAPNGGLLVVSERYDRGWHARIGGTTVRVIRANSVLMAIEIPAGAREVVLEYSAPWVRFSILLSLGAALAVLIIIVADRRAQRV